MMKQLNILVIMTGILISSFGSALGADARGASSFRNLLEMAKETQAQAQAQEEQQVRDELRSKRKQSKISQPQKKRKRLFGSIRCTKCGFSVSQCLCWDPTLSLYGRSQCGCFSSELKKFIYGAKTSSKEKIEKLQIFITKLIEEFEGDSDAFDLEVRNYINQENFEKAKRGARG